MFSSSSSIRAAASFSIAFRFDPFSGMICAVAACGWSIGLPICETIRTQTSRTLPACSLTSRSAMSKDSRLYSLPTWVTGFLPAGKNPVTHVGKLYNLLSFDIADRLVKEQAGKVREVWVRIVSQIGKPIDQPQAATAQIIPEKGSNLKALEKDAAALIDEELENIYKLTDRIVAGKVRTF